MAAPGSPAAATLSAELFTKVFQASPAAISIATCRDGRYLEVNDSFLRMLGYSRDEVIGRPAAELSVWVSAQGREKLIRMLDTKGTVRGEQFRLRTKAGVIRDVMISAEQICVRGETYILAVTQDITEARRAAQALAEGETRQRAILEKQLWRAQKLESVGRLAGGVAHDFNNLVTVIGGYSDLLLMNLAKDNLLRRHVEEVKKAGDRAASLTRQLLAFSRRQVLDPRILDLNAVIGDVGKMLRRLIGEDIDLLNGLHPGLWPVQADHGQLEQVLVNLAVNARDAMPEGGKLTLETANVTMSLSQGERYEPPMPPGHYVMLAVSDTGIGMDSETESHIFEPFFTTKEEGKGTGLGLSTVYGIVKQSGGYIWATSEPKYGTTFKIYLPRAEGIALQASGLGTHSRPTGGIETVLVAEDEAAVRSLVRNVLESAGYTVLDAGCGDEALRIARARRGQIDLLLTDVVMPRMSGCELAKQIQALEPGIQVIYMSGYTGNAIVHRGILDPDTILLQKPFSPDDLVRKVREALDASDPALAPR
ncbi:MAG: ATP-binding protein [Terriglobia bacterium]